MNLENPCRQFSAGPESNIKPATEKQGALTIAIYLPTKYSPAPSQGGVF
jgi:hypothetical protein